MGTMAARTQVPRVVAAYGHRLARSVDDHGNGQLLGAYLHGSASLGGWQPTSSDVDMVVVLRDATPQKALAAVEAVLEEHGRGSPGTGLECSVVAAGQAAKPRHPWPFLLHVHVPRGQEPTIVPGDSLPGDRDLLMHYAVCRAAGVPLVGPNPQDVFGPVPRSAVLDYLVDELRWGLTEASTAYAVLNSCRALTFATYGELVSKVAGGQLAVEGGLGPVDVIVRALDEQQGRAEPRAMTPEAAAFVEQVIATLDSEARRRGE